MFAEASDPHSYANPGDALMPGAAPGARFHALSRDNELAVAALWGVWKRLHVVIQLDHRPPWRRVGTASVRDEQSEERRAEPRLRPVVNVPLLPQPAGHLAIESVTRVSSRVEFPR